MNHSQISARIAEAPARSSYIAIQWHEESDEIKAIFVTPTYRVLALEDGWVYIDLILSKKGVKKFTSFIEGLSIEGLEILSELLVMAYKGGRKIGSNAITEKMKSGRLFE